MDNSSKKTSAFDLSGEKIARLLSIGREDDSSGVVREDESVADLRIEGYEVVEKIAEAGQGRLWRAIQLSTGRQVAIKAPRAGSLNPEGAMLRFEREIELVARLEHPHIARIYDSGVDRGQYYYVMDFIGGLNLDEYVRQNELTRRQILELVRTICLAVQHAHQNRVIHRDLKPSNIIVTKDGHPYVVDFGLAKAIFEDEQGPTISMDGETVGTPAYMSPEQAAGCVDEVDTRTDIYSLGVILFNLLTGEYPHDLSGSRQQVLRRIADGQVKRPRTVCRSIDRDLESLLLKTLDRDPDRRYSTASGLADDIGNYLDGAPLMAGPPSATYRLKKFVRRNAALSSVVLAAIVTLIIGIIATTAMYVRADHAREEAQAVSDFLRLSVLRSIDPFWVGGRQIDTRSVLDAAAESLEGEFTGPPLVRAEIGHALGFAYWSLGLYELAELHHKRAIELGQAHLGPEHPTVLEWIESLGGVYYYQSRYREAGQLRAKALRGFRRALGEDDDRTLHAMWTLASVYYMQGHFRKAEQLAVKALEGIRNKYSKDDKRVVDKMCLVASGYHLQGRYLDAERLCQEALEISRRLLGEVNYWTLTLKHLLGEIRCDLGRYEEAEQLLLKALDDWRQGWSPEHPSTLSTMAALGRLYYHWGRNEEAESLFVEALEASQRVLRDGHLLSLQAMHGLGVVHLSLGRYDEAEVLLTDALEATRVLMGEQNWATLHVMNSLANLYAVQSHRGKAEQLYLETMEARRSKLGEDHPATLETKNDLAVLYKGQARHVDAEKLLLESIEGRRLKLGDTHPHTEESINNLVDLYEAWNKLEKAEEWRAQLPQVEDFEG